MFLLRRTPLPLLGIITIPFVWISVRIFVWIYGIYRICNYKRLNLYGAKTREEIVINYLEALKQKDKSKIERLLPPESTPDAEEIKQKIDRLGGYLFYQIAEIHYFQDKPFLTRVTIKVGFSGHSLQMHQFEDSLLMRRQAAITLFGTPFLDEDERWYLDLVKKPNSSTNIPAAEATPPAGVIKK
jgi:hypothetical protein